MDKLFILILGLGLMAWAIGILRRACGTFRLGNTAPVATFTPYDPNSETHKGGRVSKIADAAISVRWSLVTFGVSSNSVKANTASTTPIGVVDDTTDTITSDLTIPLSVNLIGSADRTLKVAVNSTVAQGDWLIPDSSNPIYGMTDPGNGTSGARFGRALTSGVAGGTVEFDPVAVANHVSVIATGVATANASSTSDTIAVVGMVATDTPIVTLNTVAGSESYVKTAQAGSGVINLVLANAATSGTTKYNYAVYRVNNS